MSLDLGKIEKVNVRHIRKNEATDFTPWLAQEENIQKLGEAVGLELEVENTEVAVGPYSADILAKDTGRNEYVVIENQLEKTNHDHLGKAITYSSVLDASAVIWIATGFSDEHVKAFDWLNEHTSEDVAFYAVQVELWKIDQSRPAVRFHVLSRPAEIIREAARTKASGKITETKQLQWDFWKEFRRNLISQKVLPSARQARPQYWYDVPLGKAGIHLNLFADTWGKRIGIRVYIKNTLASEALPQLESQKDAIEKEIGESLIWNPNPENRDKTITLSMEADISNRDNWKGYIEWLVNRTELFRRAFMPRVRALQLDSALNGV